MSFLASDIRIFFDTAVVACTATLLALLCLLAAMVVVLRLTAPLLLAHASLPLEQPCFDNGSPRQRSPAGTSDRSDDSRVTVGRLVFVSSNGQPTDSESV